MGKMDKKICLDSDKIINFLKNKDNSIEQLLNENYWMYTTTINAFELRLRNTNLKLVEEFLQKIQILPFDDLSSATAAEIHKKLKSEGKMIDIRDLFIASISIRNGAKLLTNNKKHFERIENLELA